MEDEGTPPAEHEGFLSGDVSPMYNHARQTQDWQSTARPRGHVKERGPKQRALAADSNAAAVDLVMLLEENWYCLAQKSSAGFL